MRTTLLAASAVVLAGAIAFGTATAATITRTADASGVTTVSVGQIVFPSAAAGTDGNAMQQVDEVVDALNARLATRGLSIGNLVHHTLYVKSGAVQAIKVIQRFHDDAHKLGPALVQRPSVGIVVQVPRFANPNTLVMADIIAAAPRSWGHSDNFARIRYVYGPQVISESLRVNHLVFTGAEGFNYQTGKLPGTVDGQVGLAFSKLHDALMRAGIGMGHYLSQDLFINKRANAHQVIRQFDQLAQKTHPGTKTFGARTAVLVDGMVSDTFMFESGAIASTGNPATYIRVPFKGTTHANISKSISDDALVFLSSLGGANLETGSVPQSLAAQIQGTVENVNHTLAQSGLSYVNVVKQRLFIKNGTNIDAALKTYHEAVRTLAPNLKTATAVVIVEGFPNKALDFEASIIAARPADQ